MATRNEVPEKTDIRAVWFTLLGIVITAGISWVSATQTASVSFRQSCLARVDARESLIQSKVEAFFAAQGRLTSFGNHRIKEDDELESRVDEVAARAYALTTYLDGDIAKIPQLISLDLMNIYSTNKTEEEIKNAPKNSENLGDKMDKWDALYKTLIKSFDVDRKRC
jgi:hypothetical protein